MIFPIGRFHVHPTVHECARFHHWHTDQVLSVRTPLVQVRLIAVHTGKPPPHTQPPPHPPPAPQPPFEPPPGSVARVRDIESYCLFPLL